jgi:4,5-DOPA dioxygenase extradiol
MHRKDFMKYLAMLPLAAAANRSGKMELKEFARLTEDFGNSELMPVVFVGHGNPMNAISANTFSRGWAEAAKKLPVPKAVLCISAHWLTNGTSVAIAPKPKTIHDFGGFPDELYRVNYPAPGSPEFAELTAGTIVSTKVEKDAEWGLDHGAWSVLMHMYPRADVPVFQLSIDFGKPPSYHYQLGKELAALRKKGVLVMASGNVVHNLGRVSWDNSVKQYDWALEFDGIVKSSIETSDDAKLIHYDRLGRLAQMAHPTNDHYLPLMYTLGMRQQGEKHRFFNDAFDLGSISMRSVVFG